MIDEECQLPGGNDQSLCNKICQRHANNKRLANVKTDKTSFVVNHFAGNVKYKIDGFMEKNKDQLSDDTVTFILSTKNEAIKSIFQSYFSNLSPVKGRQKRTISTQFSGQLDVLMKRIGNTEAHFIRCIKPNQKSVPNEFERVTVNEQLRCGGMLQVVQVSRAGYPVRVSHHEFLNRFHYLLSQSEGECINKTANISECALVVLKVLISKYLNFNPFDNGSIGFGKNLIFFKNEPYEQLYSALQKLRNRSVVKIQSYFRGMIQRRLYLRWMHQIVSLQIWLRYKINRIRVMRERMNAAILLVQSTFKMYIQRRKYLKLIGCATRIESLHRKILSQLGSKDRYISLMATKLQALWKSYKVRKYYVELKNATTKAQLRWRSILARRQLRSLRMEAKSLGTMIKRVQDLQEQVKEERAKRTDSDAKLLQMSAKVNGLLEKLADLTNKYQLLLRERDSLNNKLIEAEETTKRTLEDLKMIKEFVSREAVNNLAPKHSSKYENVQHDSLSVDIVLCGPKSCGKSRLVELALVTKGDENSLNRHRSFELNRNGLSSFVRNVYEFPMGGITLRLLEIPGDYINTAETRDILANAYLIAACFDATDEATVKEGINLVRLVLSQAKVRHTNIYLIQNDFLLIEKGIEPSDVKYARNFAHDNEIIYLRVNDLYEFIKKVTPFVESKRNLRSIISTKQEFHRQKSLKNQNKSALTVFYERFRNFWTGVNNASHNCRLLQPTIVVDSDTKLPPLSLKRVYHHDKCPSAVTCLALRPEEPTDKYVLFAVGRRNGAIDIFHCDRTPTEKLVLSGGLVEGEYPLDQNVEVKIDLTLSLHKKAVTSMSFSKVNVNELLSTSVDCTIKAWNVITGELIKVFNDSSPGLCIFFHPLEPSLFICCNSSPSIRIVDYNTASILQKFRTKSELRCLTFDDTMLNCIAGSERGTVCVYESQANFHLKLSTTKQISRGPVTCITFVPATTPDSIPCLLANVCSGNITVLNCIYDSANGKISELTYRYTVNNNHVALPLRSCYSSFGGGWCISGSEDRNVIIFSLLDENMPYSIGFHQGPVVAVGVNQLDTLLVTSDSKGVVAIWRRIIHNTK